MIFWIILAIFAYFLNAIVSVLDKHFVSKTELKPVAYAFYSGFFPVAAVLLIPFGFVLPEAKYLFAGFAGGATFVFALVMLYSAIKISEASRVIPAVGSLMSVFTFLMALIFLGERLAANQIAAFIFFIIGGGLLFLKFDHKNIEIAGGIGFAAMAALLFAVSSVLAKAVYLNAAFLSGFIIIQIGSFLGASALLLSSKNRKEILAAPKAAGKEKEILYLGIPNKFMAAAAAILLSYAVSLGSVTIINSLQAVQYVFVLVFSVFLSKKYPLFFKEQSGIRIIRQKILAISIISIGLALLLA